MTSAMTRRYGTAINCMDGSVQGAVRKFMKRKYGLTHVDKITAKGPVRKLSQKVDREDLRHLYWMLEVTDMLKTSIENHGSRIVAIAAHHQCAGNPTTRKRQIKQLRRARRTVEKIIRSFRLNFEVKIILLWINDHCMPREISSLPTQYFAAIA